MDGIQVHTDEKTPSRETRAREITVLRSGERAFESTGYSYIKITAAGVAEVVKLPIGSTGVTEGLERLRNQEPKAPSIQEIVFSDTPAGNELGLRRGEKKIATVPNLNDPGYKAAMDKHRENIVMEVLNQGLRLRFLDSNGNEITDPKQKLEELKLQGVTGEHYRQITEDIRALTTLTDKDRESFFVPRFGFGNDPELGLTESELEFFICEKYARCDVERFRELKWETRLEYRLYAERQGEREMMRQRKREEEADRAESTRSVRRKSPRG